MKKTFLLASLTILCACGGNNSSSENKSIFTSDETPKCEDSEVTNTVLSMLNENITELYLENMNSPGGVYIGESAKIKNIMTTNKNEELKSCGCEGTIESGLFNEKFIHKANVSYVAQKNSEGEIIVKIEDVGAFSIIENR